MQQKSKLLTIILVGGIIIVSLYGVYYWKTTYYSIPEDYPRIFGN